MSDVLQKKNPGGGDIFPTCPGRSWGRPSFLYIGSEIFSGGKAAGVWC
jgi:hypothetical protein